MAVAAARAMGAAEVSLEARYPHQIELGERLGATQPSGVYDVVIEAAGSESALHRCTELAAPGGSMGVLGVFGPETTWPQLQCFMKELRTVPALGVLPPRARSRLRRRRQPPGDDPDLVDALDHPPVPDRGRGRSVPGRGRQVHRRSARGDRAIMKNVMNHVGQCVTDLERSRTFYEQALGFDFWRILELDDEPEQPAAAARPAARVQSLLPAAGSVRARAAALRRVGRGTGALPGRAR